MQDTNENNIAHKIGQLEHPEPSDAIDTSIKQTVARLLALENYLKVETLLSSTKDRLDQATAARL